MTTRVTDTTLEKYHGENMLTVDAGDAIHLFWETEVKY